MTLLSIFANRVLYLFTYVTAPRQDTQQVQAAPAIKCDWVPRDLKTGAEDIAGNFGGLTLFIASILSVVVLFALIILFASKWRNQLLMVLVGVVIVGTIASSGINLVASKC